MILHVERATPELNTRRLHIFADRAYGSVAGVFHIKYGNFNEFANRVNKLVRNSIKISLSTHVGMANKSHPLAPPIDTVNKSLNTRYEFDLVEFRFEINDAERERNGKGEKSFSVASLPIG